MSPKGMQHFPLMVPGATSSAPDITVHAPYDRKPIGSVAAADAATIETALATAYKLFRNRDQWLPAAERIRILAGTADAMEQQAEHLAVEAAREGGKPLTDSRVEVTRAIDSLRICIETLRTEAGEVVPMRVNPASAQRIAFTQKEPIGVVVAVSAFNHPLNLIAHQVGPAIATGCPVIIKPAEATPLSCFRLVELLRQAGLPDEWCQPLVIEDHAVAQALVTDPRVGFFSFIGSAKVGWMLRSKLAPGTRCALEHGGAAPVILAGDANLQDCTPLLAKGGFYHGGQVCVSVQRVFAERNIANTFAEQLAAIGDKMTIGDPTLEDTDIGPLIRPGEVDRVEQWVSEAVTAGATLVSGGKRQSDTCFAPTVLLDPPDDARVSTQEIFGPVICVYTVDDIDDALGRANSLPVAFQAAVFTGRIDIALKCYSRLDASAVMVNDFTAFRVDWMPFAGLRHSGHGVGGVPHTMRDMWIEKLMVVRSGEIIP